MGVETKIQWCSHTFNPWIGCAKVSPGCEHCYAEAEQDHRYHRARWGVHGTRHVTSDENWKKPLKWDREAAAAGERRRVFCSSLADVFEDRLGLLEPRRRLFRLIEDTPCLDWLLLTKRPECVGPLTSLTPSWAVVGWPPNVWLGTSVEDQRRARERVGPLLSIPAAIHFVSLEPMLEPVDFGAVYCTAELDCECPTWYDALRGVSYDSAGDHGIHARALDWVIVGGESGPHARPCDLAWIRSIRDQCRDAGVACFVKQLGSRAVVNDPGIHESYRRAGGYPWALKDGKGGDIDEWPHDLRIREFPR